MIGINIFFNQSNVDIACDNCTEWYHPKCVDVNFSKEEAEKITWYCPNCITVMGKKRKNPFAKTSIAEEPKVTKKIRNNSNNEITSQIQIELNEVLKPSEDQPKEFLADNVMEGEDNGHQNEMNKIDVIEDTEELKIQDIKDPSIPLNHINTLKNEIDDNILHDDLINKEKEKIKPSKHKGKIRRNRIKK